MMFWERCKRYVARLIDGLRYFVFPRRCAACGRLLSRAEEAVCVECLGKLIPFHYSESVQSAFFFPLTDKGYAIKCGFLFEKEGVCRNIIHHIKYYGSRETGIYFGHLLARQLNLHREDYDFIVPIPIHPRKLPIRGYNQAEEIARGISIETGIPLLPHALKRTRLEQSQTTVHRTERLERMKDAFAPGKTPLPEGSRVLLFDDVLTTGATLSSAARVLEEAKPAQITLIAASADMPD